MRSYKSPDGTHWGVEVKLPGASSAMIMFHHPNGKTAERDRYAHYIWHGPESRSVTARVPKDSVMRAISDEDLALLFRRSMPIAQKWSSAIPQSRNVG
jgi:hypothetical protein